jgi:aspartyl-tRNA(Asn)/glutamyl-tRNA(Gln) amidotransferase subunit A
MKTNTTIRELHYQLKSKLLSPVELLKSCFTAIDKSDPTLNAFITQIDRDQLLKQAAGLTIDHPLSGIPYVLKDAYLTSGIRTTAASNMLKNYIPQYDATLYKKLSATGALLLGKTNQDAWGHGASTENTDFGPSKNPWDITRVAGGSSGGAAASIASGMSIFGIGEDTGGSIRNPAGWCGISGLKVT